MIDAWNSIERRSRGVKSEPQAQSVRPSKAKPAPPVARSTPSPDYSGGKAFTLASVAQLE